MSVRVLIADQAFPARWEPAAPLTRAALEAILPYEDMLIHARWSGEACWVPMGGRQLGVGPENPVGAPAPGQILLYPGGISETEILVPYGPARFACGAGPLVGNHVLTITEGLDTLAELGRDTLWRGAAPIRFEVG